MVRLGSLIETTLFIVVMLLVAKFVVRNVAGGRYAAIAEDF